MKNNKIILSVLVILVFSAYGVYSYMYQKHPVIETQSAVFVGSGEQLMTQVEKGVDMWQNKVVEIDGTITGVDPLGITLNSGIYCQLKNEEELLIMGSVVTVKGRVIGYDDLLEELKLDQTIILKQTK